MFSFFSQPWPDLSHSCDICDIVVKEYLKGGVIIMQEVIRDYLEQAKVGRNNPTETSLSSPSSHPTRPLWTTSCWMKLWTRSWSRWWRWTRKVRFVSWRPLLIWDRRDLTQLVQRKRFDVTAFLGYDRRYRMCDALKSVWFVCPKMKR